MCYNKDRAVSPARLVRGLIGAHNERPHGDSKVPPYSVKARLGLMRSAPAGTHCNQCGGPSAAVLCCASTAHVADGRGLLAAATERHVGARGHAQQLGTTLGRTTRTQWESPLIAHCRLGATAVTTLSDNFPSLASPGQSQTASGAHPSAHRAGWARPPRAGGDGGRSTGPGRRPDSSQCLSPRYWLTQGTGGWSRRCWLAGGGRRGCPAVCRRSHPSCARKLSVLSKCPYQ